MGELPCPVVRFNYELFGEGVQKVVFISGYTCDINFWRPVADAIKQHAQVLIFDNQGIGETQDAGAPLSIEIMANNIKLLLDELGISEAVVVGFAMGSTIAQQLAYNFPCLVSKLILLSPVLSWSQQAIGHINDLIKSRAEDDMNKYQEKLYSYAYGSAYKKRVSLTQFKKMQESSSFSQTLEDQRRQAEALKAFDSRNWVHEIRAPIVVLSPLEDQFALPEDAKALVEKTGAVLETLQCGHAAMEEELEQVIELCKTHSLITCRPGCNK